MQVMQIVRMARKPGLWAFLLIMAGCDHKMIGFRDYLVYLPNDYYLVSANDVDVSIHGPLYQFPRQSNVVPPTIRKIAIIEEFVVGCTVNGSETATRTSATRYFLLDTAKGVVYLDLTKDEWIGHMDALGLQPPQLQAPVKLYLERPNWHKAQHLRARDQARQIVEDMEKHGGARIRGEESSDR